MPSLTETISPPKKLAVDATWIVVEPLTAGTTKLAVVLVSASGAVVLTVTALANVPPLKNEMFLL
jgi:hypothetical protein